MKTEKILEFLFKIVITVAAFLIAASFNAARTSFEQLKLDVVSLKIQVAEIDQRQISREEIVKLIDERIHIYHH